MQSDYLKVALKAAKRAEKIVMKCFKDCGQIDIKSDKSPVTLADKEAEKIIKEIIKGSFPDHGFLGEESGEDNLKKSEYLWIIDPIDGTNNFIRGIPIFATEIALMKKGELILGVSNASALKELMWAEKGGGAYLNGKKIKVSVVKNLNEAFISYGNFVHFEDSKKMEKLSKLVRETRGHRGFGDFWAYHLLAQGKIDIVLEARVKIWDIAAMKIIVEEAGAKMTDFEGNSINKKTKNVVATNGWFQNCLL